MYEGFLSLGGIEIGNADRVQSYARNRGFYALRQDPLHDGLHVALEEEPYTSPLLDDAPWVDERDPATHKFLGILPIGIKGVSDSTRTAEVTQSIVEGGTVGDGRAGTRELRYTGLIVAEDDLGAEVGMSWLRKIAEGDQCGMHEACGMSDLTFFLDKPEVCASLYSKRIDWTKTQIAQTGAISPGADLIYRFAATRDIEQPIRGGWALTASQGDGVELSWGLLDIDSGDVIEETETPLLLQRTNLLSNPSFTAGLNGASITAGTGVLSREAAFGVDGGAHARVTPADGSSVRTNWVPDPRFVLDPAVSPWRTNGKLTVVADGGPVGLPYGGFVATDPAVPLYAEFSAQGPVRESGAPMLSTLSIYVATSASAQVEITVTDNFGTQTSVARQAVDANAGYTRLVAQLSVGKSYVVRVSAPVASMSVGGALLEGGAVLGDFFDGSDYDATYAWVGGVDASRSTRSEAGVVRENRVIYPRAKGGWSSWYGSGGAGTHQYLTGSNLGICDTFVRSTITTKPSGALTGPYLANIAVDAGKTYTVSVYVRGWQRETDLWRLGLLFQSAAGNIGGEVTPGGLVVSRIGDWTRLSATVVAPEGAITLRATTWQNGVANVGDMFDATAMLVEETSVLQPYFDGSMSDSLTYAWTGAANKSSSRMTKGMAGRVNRTGNPLNGTSLDNLSASRATLSLGADFVRSTVTDTTPSPNAQRLQIGPGNPGVPGAVPVTPGERIPFSVDLRNSRGGTMAIQAYYFTPAGAYAAFENIALSIPTGGASAFTRFSGVATVPAGVGTLVFYIGLGGTNERTIGDTFDVRRLMVGDTGAYFDGSGTSDGPRSSFFLDGTPSSASRMIIGTRTQSTLEISPVAGVYGPMVASFAARSRESAEITASMISTDDGTVLATRTFIGGETWERVPLVTPFGRSVRLRFTAKGRLELDQMVVENASVVYDYFDGDSFMPPRPDLLNLAADIGIKQEYETRWTSTPYASPSKTTWLGGLYFSHEDGRARPFLRALQGRLASTQIAWVDLTEITMDEQLDPYERTFHGVSVVEGPTEIERMRMGGGVAVRFSMLLVAESPAMLGRRVEADLPDFWWLKNQALYAPPQLVSRNYVANPINAGSTFPAVQANTVGSTITDIYLRIPGLSQMGSRARRITRSTATADDSQTTQSSHVETMVPGFHASVWVRTSSDRSMFLAASLDDQAGTLPTEYRDTKVVKKGVWTKLSVTMQSAQGVLSSLVRFGSTNSGAAGDYYEYTALFVTRGTFPTAPDFFHGSMLETPTYTYGWQATAHNSASLRTERTKVSSRDLVDPSAPALPQPPKPPVVGTIFPDTQVWTRTRAQVPADLVEAWALAVPTVTVRTLSTTGVRNLRLRFHANPFGYDPADVDPESYCGEMLISYIPADTTFVLDGVTRSATAQIRAAAPIPADQNVVSSNGGPVNWPELTCGVPYVVTAEFPQVSGASDLGWIDDIRVELTRKE